MPSKRYKIKYSNTKHHKARRFTSTHSNIKQHKAWRMPSKRYKIEHCGTKRHNERRFTSTRYNLKQHNATQTKTHGVEGRCEGIASRTEAARSPTHAATTYYCTLLLLQVVVHVFVSFVQPTRIHSSHVIMHDYEVSCLVLHLTNENILRGSI